MSKKAENTLTQEELVELAEQLEALEEQVQLAQTKEQRALADYQNLLRRTQQDQTKMAKLATKNFVQELLQPLDHLRLAAEQIKDAGLDMVITQLWQTLESNGLQKIETLGKKFDVTTMEVVETENEGAEIVVKEVRAGYLLNGEVIQHAKVVVGNKN